MKWHLSIQIRHKYSRVLDVLLIHRVTAPAFGGRLLEQRDAAHLSEQKGDKEWGDDTEQLRTRHHRGRREEETRPHEDLPEVVRVAAEAPQARRDELALKK